MKEITLSQNWGRYKAGKVLAVLRAAQVSDTGSLLVHGGEPKRNSVDYVRAVRMVDAGLAMEGRKQAKPERSNDDEDNRD